MASPYGGVNIEEIAKASPSYIYKDGIDITTGEEKRKCVLMNCYDSWFPVVL